MKNLNCPAYITALIHFHCYSEPIRDAPVNRDAIKDFLAAGLIERGLVEGSYTTTPLGAAYVQSLCQMPPPEIGFIDALGNRYASNGFTLLP